MGGTGGPDAAAEEEVGTRTGAGSFLGDVEAEGGLIDDGNSNRRPTVALGVMRKYFLRSVLVVVDLD